MALSGSAWKHVSSSGASTPSGRSAAPEVAAAPRTLASVCGAPAEVRSQYGCVASCRVSGVLVPSGLCCLWWCALARGLASAARACLVVRASRQQERSGRLCARCLLLIRHRMRQDYPLNLSISLSGGKETNQDALSNGE